MKSKENKYNFVLVLSGITEPTPIIEDAIYESDCNDALLSFRNQIAYLEFDREAASIEDAVISAIQDVESSGIGVKVVRVEPGDLVTASEISRRANTTKEYIRLLKEGKRGKGNFPIPFSGITTKTLIWSWAEVVRWMYDRNRIKDNNIVFKAEFLRDINEALEFRDNANVFSRRKNLLKKLNNLPSKV